MALNAYLRLQGQKQGDIKGSVIQKGREGMIAVFAYNHEIIVPRDPATGMATGKRQHKPFVITKELDKSSPLLYNALINNETLGTMELKCWAPQLRVAAGAGAEVNHFNILFTNAQIASIKNVMHNNRYPDLANLPLMEEVAFTYQKIEWVWTDGNITAIDDF